jgi:hypothetical protein
LLTEVVEYAMPVGKASFTVSEATVLIGMRRTRLRLDASQAAETDIDRRLLRLFTYPDVCAAVVSVEGLPGAWPPDFETFAGLPDGLVAKLEEAVYRLNPHWLPGGAPGSDPKVSASARPPSINGSRTGRKRKTKTASSSPT